MNSNINIRSPKSFSKEEDLHNFNTAFIAYANKIFRYENPQNLTLREIEVSVYPHFNTQWDWDQHCLIPEEKPDIRRKVRYYLNKDKVRIAEMYVESTGVWVEIDQFGNPKKQ